MSDIEKIANELIENGQTINYNCRCVLDYTLEQSYILYDKDIYVITYIANEPVSIVMK